MPKIIEEPREAILFHAKSIVEHEGIEQLTIRKVAKNAGISIGTVYNYFPTKRDLTVQLMEDYWASYFDVLDEIHRQEPDFYKKLLQLYKQLEDFVRTFKEVWVKNSTASIDDQAFLRRKHFFDKLCKRLENILLDAQTKEVINLSIEPCIMANFLMLNFFMMSMINQFDYANFERIIKKLFQ